MMKVMRISLMKPVRCHSSRLMSTDIKRVGVVGLGLMGHGVAQVIAQAGYQVVAVESTTTAMETGMKRIQDSLSKIISKDVAKGKYDEAQGKKSLETTLSLIKPSTSLQPLESCDLVIEAIIEDMNVKIRFYEGLADILGSSPNTIFASNTSSLPITGMALASRRPEKFVGLHFFNPVQIMKLVEVIRSDHTNPDVFEAMVNFTTSIGKNPVRCKDTPGFIVNRLLVPYLASALAMLERNDATIQDIDVSMQLGAGHPMGPIMLADYVGLDTTLSILEGWKVSHPQETDFKVPQLLRDMVKKGHFGRKTGKGFYEWKGDKAVGVAK